jgi:hypothetical protein
VNALVTEIERLREQLYDARRCIVDLMPEHYGDMLESYYRCESRPDRHRWQYATADEIVDDVIEQRQQLANIADRAYYDDRAPCPLCGGESSSPYTRGFALPEGLRRHLTGWGQSQRCPVMEQTRGLAQDYWRSKFADQDQAEEDAKEAQLAERRKSETLYRTTPGGKSELIDAGYYGTVRTPDGLQWAEDRLRGLGFTIDCTDRVWSATWSDAEFTVYADPRLPGQISFRAYPTAGARRRARHIGRYHPFSLPDAWKHDLPGKFRARLPKTTEKSSNAATTSVKGADQP